MLSDLTDKRVLVTGAANGLGRATAELFVQRGARVLLADIDETGLAGVRAHLGEASRAIHCDVTNEADAESAVATAVDEFGGLDIAVNNAGVEMAKPLTEQSDDEFSRLMNINVKGVFLGMKYQAPAMSRGGGGVIVNMSSVAGLGAVPLLGSYCASKAAVLRLSEVAALEFRDQGVRVDAVCPSFIDTNMVERLVDPFEAATGSSFDDVVALNQQRLGTAQEVAEMVAFLASDDAQFVNGSHYVLDGGLTGSLF